VTGAPPACLRCGAVRDPADPAALAWACEPRPDGGPAAWLCPACTRAHARDIEAKLPPEWW
jgi:hypothetical protein